MKCIIVFIFCLPLLLNAQVSKIVYDHTVSWSKIVRSLPYLSKEEKDRISLTWGKDENEPTKYILAYDKSQATYQLDFDNLPVQEYHWKREKMLIHTNLIEKRRLDNIEVLGKAFIFDDNVPKIKWKILNEIKEVSGYVCMKAETIDTIKNQKIIAWFTYEIPVSLGPESFGGLPGLILEINKNDGCAVITATSITLNSIATPLVIPKKKGKKMTNEKYDIFLSNHIKESIASNRNPYWSIHY
ncbi:MAG: GLPGLI family protein [Saprospiraceae bacterium]